MKIISTVKELREALKPVRLQEIGFIPTMGYLHEGHLSLVKRAKETTDIVVMSIFVNPIQFGPNEDLSKYPRDIERDSLLASEAGVDFLFIPTVEEMYPVGSKTIITVKDITDPLCGASRPGHFDGVATVVTKLFNIVQPDYAFFGMKDAQQVAVIKQMTADLNIPVEIIPCEIVREGDGLALSSRNVYLSAEERRQALVLSASLQKAKAAFSQGETDAGALRRLIENTISESPLSDIDYIEIRSYPTLEEVQTIKGDVLIALAVRFGNTRLIDNTILTASQEETLCSVQ